MISGNFSCDFDRSITIPFAALSVSELMPRAPCQSWSQRAQFRAPTSRTHCRADPRSEAYIRPSSAGRQNRFEDGQDFLSHGSSRITSHYSGSELESLGAKASKVSVQERHKIDTLAILRTKKRQAGEFSLAVFLSSLVGRRGLEPQTY